MVGSAVEDLHDGAPAGSAGLVQHYDVDNLASLQLLADDFELAAWTLPLG